MYKSIKIGVILILGLSSGCKNSGLSTDTSQPSQFLDVNELLETALEKGPYQFLFSKPFSRDSISESELPIYTSGIKGLVLYSNFNEAVDEFLQDTAEVNRNFFDLTPLSDLAEIGLFKEGHAFEINNRSTDPNNAFAHYNPKWIIWASNNLIPDPASKIGNITAQVWYDKSFRRFFRLLVESYELIDKKGLWEYETRNYYEALKSEEFDALRYFDHRFQNELTEYAYPYSHQVMTGPMAISFWLRRDLDGSRSEFKSGLLKFMNQYDQEWLQEHI